MNDLKIIVAFARAQEKIWRNNALASWKSIGIQIGIPAAGWIMLVAMPFLLPESVLQEDAPFIAFMICTLAIVIPIAAVSGLLLGKPNVSAWDNIRLLPVSKRAMLGMMTVMVCPSSAALLIPMALMAMRLMWFITGDSLRTALAGAIVPWLFSMGILIAISLWSILSACLMSWRWRWITCGALFVIAISIWKIPGMWADVSGVYISVLVDPRLAIVVLAQAVVAILATEQIYHRAYLLHGREAVNWTPRMNFRWPWQLRKEIQSRNRHAAERLDAEPLAAESGAPRQVAPPSTWRSAFLAEIRAQHRSVQFRVIPIIYPALLSPIPIAVYLKTGHETAWHVTQITFFISIALVCVMLGVSSFMAALTGMSQDKGTLRVFSSTLPVSPFAVMFGRGAARGVGIALALLIPASSLFLVDFLLPHKALHLGWGYAALILMATVPTGLAAGFFSVFSQSAFPARAGVMRITKTGFILGFSGSAAIAATIVFSALLARIEPFTGGLGYALVLMMWTVFLTCYGRWGLQETGAWRREF